MRETQQLFPVKNGFATVTAPSAEWPLQAFRAYKALLIELAKRDLLNKAQNARVLLEPRDGMETELPPLTGDTFLDFVRQIRSVGLEYRLDIEPPGITYTSLLTSYGFTLLDDSVPGTWQSELTLPWALLEHLTFEVSQQRDWIEKNVFPISASEDAASEEWIRNLTIRCVPRET